MLRSRANHNIHGKELQYTYSRVDLHDRKLPSTLTTSTCEVQGRIRRLLIGTKGSLPSRLISSPLGGRCFFGERYERLVSLDETFTDGDGFGWPSTSEKVDDGTLFVMGL